MRPIHVHLGNIQEIFISYLGVVKKEKIRKFTFKKLKLSSNLLISRINNRDRHRVSRNAKPYKHFSEFLRKRESRIDFFTFLLSLCSKKACTSFIFKGKNPVFCGV